MELLFQHEGSLKWALPLLAFVIFALWETYHPRRILVASAARRWSGHAILSFLSYTSQGWIYRASAVVVASAASASRYGLLNRDAVPYWVRFVVAVLVLDLWRYGQHYLYHAVPVLWRIHQVHHADPDFDWSTSLRFHPGEALLSHGSHLAVIALLAPPALAVLLLEFAVLVENMFVHANVAIPSRIDAGLRRWLITPDMHRIHHSVEFSEQNTNFGIVFPWWDRLFGTYRQEPAAGHREMRVGLREVDVQQGVSLIGMLIQPFRAAAPVTPAPSARMARL